MTTLERPGWRRITLRTILGLLLLIALLGIFAFTAGPSLVRHVLVDILSKQLHRPVAVGEIGINPFAMTARIANIAIGERDGASGETAGFDELFVNVGLASLRHMAPVVQEVRLVGPRVRLVRETSGRYNISDLLDEWLKPSDSPPAKFSVNNIKVTGGRIEFDDRPVQKTHVVSEIALALPFISNLPHQTDIHTAPAFSANIDGAPLELTGKTKPFSESRESELKLGLDRFELSRYIAYSPVSLPFTLSDGLLDTDLGILFRNDGKKAPTLAITGTAAIKSLKLLDTAGGPLFGLQQIDVPVVGLDPINGRYHLGEIRLAGLETHVRVDGSGTLNWLVIADQLKGEGKPASQPAQNSKPVEWLVDGVRLADSTIHWRDETHPQAITARASGIEVAVGSIDGKFSQPIAVDAALSVDASPHATGDRFELKGARIDMGARRIDVDEFAARGLKIAASRLVDGSIGGLLPPRMKTGGAEPSAGKVSGGEAPTWTLNLASIQLADALLRLHDQAVTPATTQTIDIAKAALTGFSTQPKSVAKLELAARLNRKGEIKSSGTFQLEPLSTKLRLDLRGLELLPLQPYFGDKVNLTVTKGNVAAHGDLALGKTAKGGLAGGYRGAIDVNDFHSVDKPDSADLLTWKSFHVDRIDFALEPLSISVGEVALSDFFASLYVSPEGKLNLAQILRKDEAQPDTKDQPAEAPSSAPASEKKEKAVAAPDKAEKAPPPPIRIDQITLQGGTVNIDDHFVKPNYSAHLTDIGGRVSGLSSDAGSTADLDLRGSYEGAPVSIAGKLNPLAAQPTLDLKAEVRGVELVPMSPYSGKYAGYAIDKGKLSLFLSYKIADKQLQAENRVFLDQLTFGEKVESPSATKLPVLLAVSLLKNRRGEIDINLPISGSLDDPQFSVGGIIVQVVVNLITKAITAPFALLGSLFGGGEELSHADFAAGRATLSDATVKRLESLAKALDDRPALKLEVTGRVDAEPDREGLRQAWLEHQLKAQKLAQLVKAGKEAGSADSVMIDDKEYLPLLEQAYKQAKFPKPRNVIGLTKSLPREEMEKLMLANAPASDDDLRELAGDRAKAIADWLSGAGKVPRERIFLLPPKLAKDDSGPKDAPLSRADFSLK